MLPSNSAFVARASACAFGLAAGLSLWNGTTEWTAAFRGMIAATACAVVVPRLYNPVAAAFRESQQNDGAQLHQGAAAPTQQIRVEPRVAGATPQISGSAKR